jgi:hypothetical protein
MDSLSAPKFFQALETIHKQLQILLFIFSKDKAPAGMSEEDFERTKETWLEIAQTSKAYTERVGDLMEKI